MLNFFLDRDVIPIEITFERDMSKSDLLDIFESIKSKIGSPCIYPLPKEDQQELFQLKEEIIRKEAEEKVKADRSTAATVQEEEDEKLQQWVKSLNCST